MLCKARPIWGSPVARQRAMQCIGEIIKGCDWNDHSAESIVAMRMRLEQGASPENLKRGIGGTMDVEFIVQSLQLRYSAKLPEILLPGTMQALQALADSGILERDVATRLGRGYRFLRQVESGLRLTNAVARHDLPKEASESDGLAYLLGMNHGRELHQACEDHRASNRRDFLEIMK